MKNKKVKSNGRPPALPPSSNGVSSDQDCCYSLLAVCVLALLITGTYYLVSYLRSPDFEVGDCAVNRAFELVKVEYVGTSYDYYTFKHMKPIGNNTFYFLRVDAEQTSYEKSISDTDEQYTKIPCWSK